MVLPFGLNTALRVFSEVMKILKKWGRRVGIMLFQYWLQLNLDANKLAVQTAQLIKQCIMLGLLVNHEKSEPLCYGRAVCTMYVCVNYCTMPWVAWRIIEQLNVL